MALKLFGFIDEVIDVLEGEKEALEKARDEIEEYFIDILSGKCDGYININSRVKSSSSLREKILRNNYYKKTITPREQIYSLSDLIGVRIECRFIKDEGDIYKVLKKHFDKRSKETNQNIILDLKGSQPQKQKNGFKIYRIDGYILRNDLKIPFELQIKSLVNIFWGEIEHKIIYKNHSYMLSDSFLKDIMSSIKKNLTMIDNQLLVMYNQFNGQKSTKYLEQKEQFEKLISKIIYDSYALKMKKSLGFIVDFKMPCDTIMRYFLRNEGQNFSDKVIKTLERLNEINRLETKFEDEILFEREINFQDEFTSIVGTELLDSINTEFQWNLFFRIIFEIEPGNNAEDFEVFIEFIRDSFLKNKFFSEVKENLSEEKSSLIIKEVMNTIAEAFVEIDSIEFIIENSIGCINDVISEDLIKFASGDEGYELWEKNKDIYLKLLHIKILSIFDLHIETEASIELLNSITTRDVGLKINSLVLKCDGILEKAKEVKAKDVARCISQV